MTVFLRSATMIAAFVVILLIAVFWNGLPSIKSGGNQLPISWKSLFQQDEEEPTREPPPEVYVPVQSVPANEEAAIQDFGIPSEPDPLQGEPAVVEIDLPEEYVAMKRTLEQEYGATEILLQPWGSEGKMYRFSCYVPQPKGSGVKKAYQEIEATPTLAIQKVMEALQ